MSAASIKPLVSLLLSSLKQPDRRKLLLGEFQEKVWDASEETASGDEWEILRELAYDLAFYEPDPKVRAEDASFFDDNRLQEVIAAALSRLNEQPSH
jgi:hypothetical protein